MFLKLHVERDWLFKLLIQIVIGKRYIYFIHSVDITLWTTLRCIHLWFEKYSILNILKETMHHLLAFTSTGCKLLPAATKLGQGNIFTSVCHSVHSGGGSDFFGGAVSQPPPDIVNARPVRILLECLLVVLAFSSEVFELNDQLDVL